MPIQPYVSFAAYSAAYPMQHHSSRVFTLVIKEYPETGPESIALSVADAFLRDVVDTTISVSVSDATLRDVVTTPHPILTLGASSITFPSTMVGSISEMILIIANTGDADLDLTSITPTGDFSVVSIMAD